MSDQRKLEQRLGAVLTRIASATSVQRTRRDDRARDERHHGDDTRAERLEAVVLSLEAAADELWAALDVKEAPLKAA